MSSLGTQLLVVDPRVGPYLGRAAAEVAAVGVAGGWLIGHLSDLTQSSGTNVMVFFGALCIALCVAGVVVLKRLANAAWCAVSRRRAVEVALDEGGLRFAGRDGLAYWPLEELDDPLVVGRWLGRVELVLTHVGDGLSERIVLFHPAAVAEAQQLEREVRQRIAALRHDLPPGAEQLDPRRDEPVVWCKRIEAAVRAKGGGAAFRSTVLGREELKALVRDVRVPAAVRGAAAYGLAMVAPDDAPAMLEDVLSEASPPILVVMIALAPTEQRIVTNEAVAAAMAYVSEELRAAVLRKALAR